MAYTDGLTDAQARAVMADDPRVVVIAGAGSGKTRVVVQRMRRLMAGVTSARQILAITFTNKAADEMRERLRDAVRMRRVELPTIKTIHGFCVRVVRSAPEVIDRTAEFWILDEVDAEDFLRRAARAVHPRTPPGARLDTLRRDEAVMREYRASLRAADAVDFDMLEEAALEVLRSAAGQALWRGRFTDILVDEYQDTNARQDEIIALLAPDRLFVVGDSRQAIYSFRGADVTIIRARIASPDWTVISLDDNFRSMSAIVDVANRICCEDAPMVARREGEGLAVYEAGLDVDECVRRALASGYRPGDIAILARTWDAAEEAAMEVTCAPTRTYRKARDAWREPVGRAALAFLTLLQSPHADELALRVCDRWVAGVDARDARAQARRRRRTVFSVLGEHEPFLGWGVEAIGARDLDSASAREALRWLAARVDDEHDRLELAALAEDVIAQGSVLDLLERMIGRSHMDGEDLGADVVHAMTVHAAKGLEWPVVILPDVRDGVYPRRAARDDRYEEDRRSLYVAASRARDVLLMTYTPLREDFMGRPARNLPTPFLTMEEA